MSLSISKTVNFGKNKTGLSTIGYTIYNGDGTVNASRTTSGITELVAGTGIYKAQISIGDTFTGYLVWDTGDASILYAAENIDYRNISGSGASVGGGGYAIIETWDKKEKNKIMSQVDKILDIVKSIAGKDSKSVREAIEALKVAQEKRNDHLQSLLKAEFNKSRIELKIDPAMKKSIDDLKEDLNTLTSAMDILIEYAEVKKMIGEATEHVEQKFS